MGCMMSHQTFFFFGTMADPKVMKDACDFLGFRSFVLI
jgi:hypothetical protein